MDSESNEYKLNKTLNGIDKKKELFRILFKESRGKSTRMKILIALNWKSMNCHQISQYLEFSWKSVYHHLLILSDAGCIEIIKPFKRTKFYTLSLLGKALYEEIASDGIP